MAIVRMKIEDIRRARRHLNEYSTRAFRKLCRGEAADMNDLSSSECIAFESPTTKLRRGFGRSRMRKELNVRYGAPR